MNTSVRFKSVSGTELFSAFIARVYWLWIIQMNKIDVFLEDLLFTKNTIAMFASVLQALMDT